jgi:hypothetical protein
MDQDFGAVEFDLPTREETDGDNLEKCRLLTQMMREHQASVMRLGKQRRQLVRKLRENRVPYRTIADACGVTDQALFADLRKHAEEEA